MMARSKLKAKNPNSYSPKFFYEEDVIIYQFA
jgi:hypothetical protein